MSTSAEAGAHTPASTKYGPDYCAECSKAAQEWVKWPCPSAESDAPDWEARAVVAEAALAQIRDMWSESQWLQFSMCALHQIRDRVLGVIESWERA